MIGNILAAVILGFVSYVITLKVLLANSQTKVKELEQEKKNETIKTQVETTPDSLLDAELAKHIAGAVRDNAAKPKVPNES